MHFGYNNPHADYDMQGIYLENVFEEKDLGMTMNNDLKWEKQCSEVVKKANEILGMIKRNFIDRSKDIILPLF